MQIFGFGNPEGDNDLSCGSKNSSPGGGLTVGVSSGGATSSAKLREVEPAFAGARARRSAKLKDMAPAVGDVREVVIIRVVVEIEKVKVRYSSASNNTLLRLNTDWVHVFI
jgi:hypothetical protein